MQYYTYTFCACCNSNAYRYYQLIHSQSQRHNNQSALISNPSLSEWAGSMGVQGTPVWLREAFQKSTFIHLPFLAMSCLAVGLWPIHPNLLQLTRSDQRPLSNTQYCQLMSTKNSSFDARGTVSNSDTQTSTNSKLKHVSYKT